MATTNMSLILPVVSETLGPEWARELNSALVVVDQHDHTSGKGIAVTPAGLNINNNLDIQDNHLNNVNSVRHIDNVAPLVDSEDIRSTYVISGDLYYNNGAGVAVQITTGASVNASSDGISRSFEEEAMNSNTTILPADTFSYIEADTTAAFTITLPPANSVSAGRFYVVKDVTGLAVTNPISIDPDGTDEIDGINATQTISSAYGSQIFASNGVDGWFRVSSYGGDIPPGTKMPFYQAAAPTGWTLDATVNDRFIRISNTAGGTTSGSFSNLSHVHPGPSHNHGVSNIRVAFGSSDSNSLFLQYSGGSAYEYISVNSYTSPGVGFVNFLTKGPGWPAGATTLYADLVTGSTDNGGTANTGAASFSVSHNSTSHAYANFIICTKN